MPAPAAEVDAAGQPVRVSSPDRVIYPATETTAEVSKLQVVEYYVAVADGVMRALRDRPTALERWTSGVHEGITLSSGSYGSVFYLTTGFHGMHVIGGLVAFVVVLLRSTVGRYSPEKATSAIVVSYYWHFVDVVWVGLYATIYLIK